MHGRFVLFEDFITDLERFLFDGERIEKLIVGSRLGIHCFVLFLIKCYKLNSHFPCPSNENHSNGIEIMDYDAYSSMYIKLSE